MKKILALISLFVLSLVSPKIVFAASPDGSGPWADSVVSSDQKNTKGGQPVSTVNPDRSHPEAALGEAEGDTVDSHMFSLGFGGSITLHFDNGVRSGVIVVEATNPDYPTESARVEVSPDGTIWTTAGNVVQDGQVEMPESVSCVNYVKIVDTSNPENFSEDTADAYDVDGVKAIDGEACQTTPTPTGEITPTPSPVPQTNNNSSSTTTNTDPGKPATCDNGKPGTPTISSIERTSGTTMKVTWTAASSATSYNISYGIKSGEYSYGVPDTGNTTNFTIGGLDPNANYFVIVRAVNGCMPGDPSGEKSTSGGAVLGASTSTGQVLGASTDTLAATGSWPLIKGLLISLLSALGIFAVTYKITRPHDFL
jgi:hypothetical protein